MRALASIGALVLFSYGAQALAQTIVAPAPHSSNVDGFIVTEATSQIDRMRYSEAFRPKLVN